MGRGAIIAAALLLLGAGPARAAEPDAALAAVLEDPAADAAARGRAVAEAAARTDAGFGDSRVAVRMILHDGRGRTSERALRLLTLEGTGEDGAGDRTLIVFDEPRSERGTALLTWTLPGDDDQWLYLPALKRVKRIAARNRSGPFVGSEFAYEDLTEEQVDAFEWRHEGVEGCSLGECHRVERIPVEPWSGYSRQVAWYDREALRLVRVEYFDRKGDLLKVLEATEWERSPEGYWRARRMDMRNELTGRRTELLWEPHAFGTGLDADDFTPEALERVR
ncbi:MAG: outer membrane lipoprotein-sorting protein [Pseudomonadales bacterium]|jgi:hypothetical protein|nr:outer membrane lipoprotein-sorting protein [Pseudomonadales bacterium]